MDIGADFDDDFFEEPKLRVLKEPSDYEAKFCVPLWYMDKDLILNEAEADEETLETLKHRSDYLYFTKDYAQAAELYERCLQLTPPANHTWKREFMENLARSLLHLDDAERALEWSLKLDKSSFSPDQKVVSMNLLAMVCHKLGKYKEELEALHCCLDVHKSCPEFWQRLGLCYSGLFNIRLPEYSETRPARGEEEEESEPCCAFNSKLNSSENLSEGTATTESDIPQTSETTENHPAGETSTKCDVCTLGIQIVSSCLIHTKMLINSNGPNIIGEEKDKETLKKIGNSLIHMEVDESFIEVASKMLGSDFLAGLQMCENPMEDHNGFSSKDNDEKVSNKDG